MLGLHCCAGFSLAVATGVTLSGCSARASHCCGFSCCRAQAVGHVAFNSCSMWAHDMRLSVSTAPAQELRHTGLVAVWCVGSSQTWDRTHVSCIGRQILYHWASRKALNHGCFVALDIILYVCPSINHGPYTRRIESSWRQGLCFVCWLLLQHLKNAWYTRDTQYIFIE